MTCWLLSRGVYHLYLTVSCKNCHSFAGLAVITFTYQLSLSYTVDCLVSVCLLTRISEVVTAGHRDLLSWVRRLADQPWSQTKCYVSLTYLAERAVCGLFTVKTVSGCYYRKSMLSERSKSQRRVRVTSCAIERQSLRDFRWWRHGHVSHSAHWRTSGRRRWLRRTPTVYGLRCRLKSANLNSEDNDRILHWKKTTCYCCYFSPC